MCLWLRVGGLRAHVGSNRSNLPTTTEFYIIKILNYFSLVAFAKVINLATPINLLH